jgi:hypothetical protein
VERRKFGANISKANRWPAASHLVMEVFASLPNIPVPPPDTPPAVLTLSSASKPCLETGVNVFARDALLAEKPDNDSLVVLHPLNEIPETDGPSDSNYKRNTDLMPL